MQYTAYTRLIYFHLVALDWDRHNCIKLLSAHKLLMFRSIIQAYSKRKLRGINSWNQFCSMQSQSWCHACRIMSAFFTEWDPDNQVSAESLTDWCIHPEIFLIECIEQASNYDGARVEYLLFYRSNEPTLLHATILAGLLSPAPPPRCGTPLH
jgi:hypothetical protein